MKTMASAKLFALLGTALSLLACDVNPSTPPVGSLSLTTSAPTVQQGFATVDGWNVKYNRFLVNVAAVNVAGTDRVLTASSEAQLFDLVPPDPQTLVSADNRTARAWENVNLEVAPATEDSALMGAVTEADRTAMVDGGFSVYVEATLTRGTETKTLRAGFTPDTKYEACTATVSGAPRPGLLIPANGSDAATVGFAGDVLFFDNLVTRGHVLRADPIVAADASGDGVIDNEELAAVALDATFRAATVGLYEQLPGVADLNAYLNEQARSVVATFRDNGTCTTTAVTEAP